MKAKAKLQLSVGPPASKTSIKAFKAEHSEAVRKAIAAREAGKTDGVLGFLPDDLDMPLLALVGKGTAAEGKKEEQDKAKKEPNQE